MLPDEVTDEERARVYEVVKKGLEQTLGYLETIGCNSLTAAAILHVGARLTVLANPDLTARLADLLDGPMDADVARIRAEQDGGIN